MPKLKPSTQLARRERILDAAEACFARTGFHRTTMQDICREASVSPGALYLYFASKEELIAGICAREREIFDSRVAMLAEAPDFFAALEKIAQHYFVDTSKTKRLVAVEMGVEATRNAQVAAICHGLEASVTDAFLRLFQRLADEGRIAPDMPIDAVTAVFQVMGDGLFWRRAVIPDYDASAVIPAMMRTLQSLLNPVATPRQRAPSAIRMAPRSKARLVVKPPTPAKPSREARR